MNHLPRHQHVLDSGQMALRKLHSLFKTGNDKSLCDLLKDVTLQIMSGMEEGAIIGHHVMVPRNKIGEW